MPITNKEAIKFSNEKLRVVADLMAQLYNIGKSMNDEWTARGLAAVIPDDASQILCDSAYGTDGADGDGRPIVTGQDLHNIVRGNAEFFVALLEDNSNERLNMILSVAVNTRG